jgi:hypothetical protein
MADKVQLSHIEVERAVLLERGGKLPSVWQGQPLLVAEPVADAQDGPFPVTGWRVIAGNDHSASAMTRSPVLAAPAQDDSHWWLLQLEECEGTWVAQAHPWPVRMRPSREARRHGLVLSWAEELTSATPASLANVEVSLSRADSPSLAWDEDDTVHVVGWLLDAHTGEQLPYEPLQAFGLGQQIARDTSASIRLPVRWITRDISQLPSGRYGITATLASLQVHTDNAHLDLITREPSARNI